MEDWSAYIAAACSGLDRLAITGGTGEVLATADGFDRWIRITHDVHALERNIYLVGNGASAALASHFAADACKNCGLRAQAFTDPALLTAVGNDLAFEEVFALPLCRLARPGDLAIAISSSGNSPNIVRGIEAAHTIGMRIVTLTGMRPDNRARAAGDLNFYVPLPRYGWAESAHQVVLHYWFDQYQDEHGAGAI